MRRLRKEKQARSAGGGRGVVTPMIDGLRTHSRRYLTGSFAPRLIVLSFFVRSATLDLLRCSLS